MADLQLRHQICVNCCREREKSTTAPSSRMRVLQTLTLSLSCRQHATLNPSHRRQNPTTNEGDLQLLHDQSTNKAMNYYKIK
ncbi:hypothetical protein HKD37_19G054574 [Glycine soja]